MPLGNRCSRCGRGLGPGAQEALFGGHEICYACLNTPAYEEMLSELPTDERADWDRLSLWEKGFIRSIREQYEERGTLSDLQAEKVEQVWERWQRRRR